MLVLSSDVGTLLSASRYKLTNKLHYEIFSQYYFIVADSFLDEICNR